VAGDHDFRDEERRSNVRDWIVGAAPRILEGDRSQSGGLTALTREHRGDALRRAAASRGVASHASWPPATPLNHIRAQAPSYSWRPCARPSDAGAHSAHNPDCVAATLSLGRRLILASIRVMSQSLAHRLFIAPLAAFAALISAYAAATPDGYLYKLLYLVVPLSIALALPPHLFIVSSVLVFAVSTATSSPVLTSLPGPIYVSDLMVLLIAARGALPRDRVPSKQSLAGLPSLFFALWAVVMIIAATRAMNAGASFSSAIRGDLALVYWPLLYFGFTRVLRERRLDVSSLWRGVAFVAVGLAAWMFLARALNQPFHDTGLAEVPTGDNTFVRRNFGFAGAFIVYPALALIGIAGMAHDGTRKWRWIVLAFLGTVATLTTLVRGEILGLLLGALVIFWLRPRGLGTTARVRTAIQLAFAGAAATVALFAVSPTLGAAIVQRTLPFTQQAEGAELNAEYRKKAVETGLRVARAHPTGLGVLDVDRLDAERIDRGYLAHSGIATLLLFGGWPALVTGLLAILATFRRSFLLPTSTPWIHPAFVGVLTMLSVYSIGAAGLAGDPWVIPLGALAVALRFTLAPPLEAAPASDLERPLGTDVAARA
jgi:hypothetical protein